MSDQDQAYVSLIIHNGEGTVTWEPAYYHLPGVDADQTFRAAREALQAAGFSYGRPGG